MKSQISTALGRKDTKKYLQIDIEMMTRAFETYITEKLDDSGISNDYLAN